MIPTPHRTLCWGDSGIDVFEAERLLGVPQRYRTGFFGPSLQRRVEDYQQANGLLVTGEVDAATWEALERRQG